MLHSVKIREENDCTIGHSSGLAELSVLFQALYSGLVNIEVLHGACFCHRNEVYLLAILFQEL